MTDQAIQNAAAVRDDLAAKIVEAERQLAEWREKFARTEQFIRDWEEFSGQTAPAPSIPASGGSIPEPKASRKPKNPKKEEVAEVSCQIIRELGRPMTRDELFDALSSKGIVIHGQNPPVVLQTMLWRMQDVIVHLKGHGYWPADTAYPSGGYELDASGSDISVEVEEGLIE